MGSDDSNSERRFTVQTTSLPDSPGRVLLRESFDRLSDEDVGGVVLALVRDCPAIGVPVWNAEVVVGEYIDLKLPSKTLRILPYCRGFGEVSWERIQEDASALPAGPEWLIVTTRPLSERAKVEIDECVYRDRMHYIKIAREMEWM